VTGPDDSDSPEIPYVRAMSVLRQATKSTPDALRDKLLLHPLALYITLIDMNFKAV
jgi:hypothetical protein